MICNALKLRIISIIIVNMIFMVSYAGDSNKGILVFGYKGELVKFHLDTKKIETINTGEFKQLSPPTLSLINKDTLVIGEELGVGKLYLFDMESVNLTFVGNGYNPTYLPPAKRLLYLRFSNEYNELAFYMADPFNVLATEILIERNSFSGGVDVIPISSDEFLFTKNINRDRVWKFNVDTNELTELRLDCIPAVWRSVSKELLCFDKNVKKYILTDIKRSYSIALNELKYANPLLYIEKLDALIYDSPRYNLLPPERRDLVLYDFKTRESKRLLKGVSLNYGYIVYVEKEQIKE